MVARFVKVVGQTLGQWVKPKTKRMTWPLHWLSLTPFPCWLVKWKSNLARVLFSWTAPAQRVGGAEGAPESSAPYRVELIRARLFILAPLSGRISCVAGTQG